MTYALSRRLFLAATGSFAAVGLAGCLAAAEVTDRSTTTTDPKDATELRISNQNGSVSVETWSKSGVEVSVLKRSRFGRDAFDRVTVERRVDGDVFRIETVYDDGGAGQLRRAAVDLTVRVPKSLAVTDVETKNGAVRVTGTTGDARLASVNGDVTATDVDGYVTLSTSNGTLEATGVTGVDGASTSNGKIDVELRDVRRDVTLSVSNGSVDAALASDMDVDVDASTGNGTVDVSGLHLADAHTSRKEVRGRLGDGANRLTIRVSNGSIDLSAL